MPFDIKNLNPAARFYWGNGKKEWVELRNVTVKQLRNIRKETVKKTVEYYRPNESDAKPFRYETDEIDHDKMDELLWDYQIVNWCITEPDGKEIPCTLENKLLMMGNSDKFANWVIECLNQMATDEKDQKEKSEKN